MKKTNNNNNKRRRKKKKKRGLKIEGQSDAIKEKSLMRGKDMDVREVNDRTEKLRKCVMYDGGKGRGRGRGGEEVGIRRGGPVEETDGMNKLILMKPD